VAASLGVVPVTTPLATAAGHAPKRGLLALSSKAGVTLYALGILTGVVGSVAFTRLLGHPVAPKEPAAEQMRVERDVAPVAVAPTLAGVADAAHEAPLAATVRRPSPLSAPSSPVGTLDAERAILDEARVALGQGDGALALQRVDAHATRYPRGFLAEEREAMAIQGLLLVSRYDDARRRELLFEQTYPHSMMLQAVRASIQSIP